MNVARQKEQVDCNYEAFTRLLGTIIASHRDQLALMRDGAIVGYFDTPREALSAAAELFPDGIFSIQEVTDEAIDLGLVACRQLNGFEKRAGFCSLSRFWRPFQSRI